LRVTEESTQLSVLAAVRQIPDVELLRVWRNGVQAHLRLRLSVGFGVQGSQ
jgi:hypothetical protein